MPLDLSKIFKAYDIRGVYPDAFDEEAARRIGWAFARFTEADRIVMGRDMRTSSPSLSAAFTQGARSHGCTVIDLGEVSTDALYFASGRLEIPGAMFTASHNPGRYNGLKVCRAGAAPIGGDSGLADVRDLAASPEALADDVTGGLEEMDILGAYADHCRSFVDAGALAPLKVAIDAGNGMAGKTVHLVFG